MKLHIDVETYSSVSIKDAGAYKYCESLDFEVMLVAYAFNDEPIEIVDLMAGEELPERFIDALYDKNIEKWAHNAAFERRAFSAIGYNIPIEQWRCSMVKAAYCGYPLALAGVSKAMGLGEFGKLSTGRALIRYFCAPVKATKSNGGRVRNLPEHDIEKWEDFKLYCINDVAAEREITKRLEKYKMPDMEYDLYKLDQEINDRGILVDTKMAENAIALDTQETDKLLGQMTELTGLDKPNSPKELATWLGAALQREVTTIAKDELPRLIAEADLVAESALIKEVIALRQQTGMTSVKKYQRMIECAGDDGRAHGLFQFYGANRTGRWAGRLIQLQNLPRNYIDSIAEVRSRIREHPYSIVSLIHDNVTDILSQLIRTALIAPEGKLLVAADFSAIEARVLSWLAGEEWRMQVFATHGKIYEASAAMMYDLPIESIAKDSMERHKGKVAELALGYQGAAGAMKQMGAEAMGLDDAEIGNIVRVWRDKNPKIVELWAAVDDAVKEAVQKSCEIVLTGYKNITIKSDGKVLTILLPSGRKLFYQKPRMTRNKWGQPSVKYMGQHNSRWVWVESYGGKFVENICQAIARDILGVAMLKMDAKGIPLVMHVHDEVVAEAKTEDAENVLKIMCDIMGEEINWAPGLDLGAEGFTTPFYKKD